MALATYTSTVWANQQPKGIHVGDMSTSGQILWGATSTVGDVAFLCKIPHGAVIADFMEDHTTGATAQGIKFGFDRRKAKGAPLDWDRLAEKHGVPEKVGKENAPPDEAAENPPA